MAGSAKNVFSIYIKLDKTTCPLERQKNDISPLVSNKVFSRRKVGCSCMGSFGTHYFILFGRNEIK
jgi:hypothetical protein